MKAIKVDRDGTVTVEEGPSDFWMDTPEGKGIIWAEGGYPGERGHAIYYDDDAMTDPGQVRATIAGAEYPLPVWIAGIEGEKTIDATLDVEKVKGDLGIPE